MLKPGGRAGAQRRRAAGAARQPLRPRRRGAALHARGPAPASRAGRLLASRSTYTNFSILPIVAAVRFAQRLHRPPRMSDGEISVPAAPINGALTALLALEAVALRVVNMPLGSSLLCGRRGKPTRQNPHSRQTSALASTDQPDRSCAVRKCSAESPPVRRRAPPGRTNFRALSRWSTTDRWRAVEQLGGQRDGRWSKSADGGRRRRGQLWSPDCAPGRAAAAS